MNILIIGGTQFVGRHLVAEAVRKGHKVSLFNRGNNANVFPELELIKGDRNSDLKLLSDRQWDVVIDTCAYVPRQVQSALDVLKNNTKQYVFISTISVYADPIPAYVNEEGPLTQLGDKSTEEITAETYGGLKVLCEEVLQKAFKDALILRPGFVAGPFDHTDRFTYWLKRASQGGRMFVPSEGNHPLQYIDARDLAAFTLWGLEKQLKGSFNVVTNPDTYQLNSLLETAKQLSSSDTIFVKASEAFSVEHANVPEARSNFPLWVDEAHQNWLKVSNKKAVQAGLHTRPLELTVQDTLAWTQTWPEAYQLKAGLTAEREKELLDLWQKA